MWPLVPLSKIGSLGERRASVVEKMSRARLGHPDYGGTSHKEGEEIWSSDGLGPVSATPVLGLGRGRVPCRIDPTGMRILFSEGHMGNPLQTRLDILGQDSSSFVPLQRLRHGHQGGFRSIRFSQ